MKLPYDPDLKSRAAELRQAGVMSEALLWRELKNKKLRGLKFTRQKNIGRFIVDFYCANKKLVIEIDGYSHIDKGGYDDKRDGYLREQGLTVIHFLDREVCKQMDAVLAHIERIAMEL